MADDSTTSTVTTAAEALAEDQRLWDEIEATETTAASGGDVPPVDQDATPDPTPAAAPAAPGATSTEKPAAATATATAAANATDIWANATAEQRAAFEATQSKLHETTTLYQRVSGTVSGLQRKLNRLGTGTTDTTTATAAKPGEPKIVASVTVPGAAVAAPGVRASIADGDAVKKVMAEYPEVAAPLVEAIRGLETELRGIGGAVGDLTEDQKREASEAHFTLVTTVHPDYGVIANSKTFRDWFATASPSVQEIVRANAEDVVDGPDVASVITLFKAETGYKPPLPKTPTPPAGGSKQPAAVVDPKRANQLDSSLTPRNQPVAVTVTGGAPDDEAAAWKYFDDIDKKKAAASAK